MLVNSVACIVLLALHTYVLRAQQPQNVLSSPTSAILLKQWSIAPDPSPADPLLIPPDSAWRPFFLSPDNERFAFGNWLLRTDVSLADSAVRDAPIGLFPARLTTAYEIHWDGILIGRNGLLGSDQERETAGAFSYHVHLPAHLATPGKHTVIVRISNHHGFSAWRWFYGGLQIGSYDYLLSSRLRSSARAFLTVGLLFIPFLFNLFLFFARNRNASHLLFSLVCFLVICDTTVGQLSLLLDLKTTFAYCELLIYQTITVLLAILFPVFFSTFFSLPRHLIVVIIAITGAVLLFASDLWSMFTAMSLVVLILSSGMTAWATWKRREGSIITLLGFIPAWIGYAFGFGFTALAAIMVICTSATTARNISRRERTEREAMLKSARLENELLRKNINPHFLLNTLTSIIVWLRKDTKSAIRLIEALADEFRMIGQISQLQQIPMGQEMALCRAHLTIMNLRKGSEYVLETSGIDENEEIPPMIFHTLIENGLTHGYENRTRGVFTLERTAHAGGLRYRLINDSGFTGTEKKDSSGFGLRYVRGRLEESYPGRWSIISRRCPEGWETIIEIRRY